MNTGLFNMGSLFRPRMPNLPPVQPAPEPPELTDEEKAKIRDEQNAKLRKRKGRASTILTSPMGDVEEPEIQKKTLLGS